MWASKKTLRPNKTNPLESLCGKIPSEGSNCHFPARCKRGSFISPALFNHFVSYCPITDMTLYADTFMVIISAPTWKARAIRTIVCFIGIVKQEANNHCSPDSSMPLLTPISHGPTFKGELVSRCLRWTGALISWATRGTIKESWALRGLALVGPNPPHTGLSIQRVWSQGIGVS